LAIFFIKLLIINRIAHKFKTSKIFYTYSIFIFFTTLSFLPLSSNTTLYIKKYTQSYTLFLLQHHNDTFLNLTGEKGKILIASPFRSATEPWHSLLKENKILPHRLLLIVAESWSFASDNKVQDVILAKIKEKSYSLDFFSEGHFFFSGATVGGEIRELCALKARSLDITQVKTTEFSHCLPIQLKNRGYQTHVLHGALANLYARDEWYPRIGFEHLTFYNNHSWPRRCHSFNGACDIDLTPIIDKAFMSKNDLFFYWLTLNSHAPYDERDIFSNRIDCLALEIDPTSESCHIIKLHAQFFDALSELMASPNMKNVEVIVVGDHPPPFFDLSQNINTFKQGQVSWIHFKTK
jgi:phosphoglycerol transferase MdoB-like AlkP superfamily enzyme